jgi:hypothetical protein
MGVEGAPLPGRCTWTHGITLRLECWDDGGRAADLPSAWRTVELASRRHNHLLLPKRCFHFNTFLGCVNIQMPQPAAPIGNSPD